MPNSFSPLMLPILVHPALLPIRFSLAFHYLSTAAAMVGRQIVRSPLPNRARICVASRHRGFRPGDAAGEPSTAAAGATTVVLRELLDRLLRDQQLIIHGEVMMAEPTEKLWALEELLAWDDATDRRYELVDGHVLAMAPACGRGAAS
jgi:hypothetical protein